MYIVCTGEAGSGAAEARMSTARGEGDVLDATAGERCPKQMGSSIQSQPATPGGQHTLSRPG
jgi:hypothetical protein